jgi:phosphoribosylanthranilate isomerase
MGVFVKICGLASEADVQAVAAMRPDAMGFVFWGGSPRCVYPEDVGAWTSGIDRDIRKVGVFVDASAEEIDRCRALGGLDVVQLHSGQDASFCEQIDSAVWRVLHLDRGEGEDWEGYPVDAFLVDSYSSQSPGGTGRVCDWDRAADFVTACRRPVVLAGGLHPGNVREAINRVQPWGVDVSSGVEREPGRKDYAKVEAFIRQCRNA